MQEFIDIHCHLLPGVDDGPVTLEASLELASFLYNAGFSKVIATPHFADDFSPEYRVHIANQHKLLTEALHKENIPLEVFMGGEVYLTPQVIEQAKQKSIPVLHNTNYVLLEFPFFQAIPSYAKQAFFTLEAHGYRPILAHPERTTAIQRDFNQLTDNISDNVLLQVNIGSLLGKYGPEAKCLAEFIIKSQMVHFLATDSHNTRIQVQLHTFLNETKYPLPLLLHENPHNILSNRPVIISPKISTTSYGSLIKHFFFKR